MADKDFYFRLNALKIINNHDLMKGEVRFISLVNTDKVNPTEEELIEVKTNLFKNVKDGQYLNISPGKLLYHATEIPNFLNWSFMIIEDDEDKRKTGKILDQAVKSEEFKGVNSALGAVMKSTPHALVAQASAKILTLGLSVLAQALLQNSDDQIGLKETTFIHKLDNIENYEVLGEVIGDARISYSMIYI